MKWIILGFAVILILNAIGVSHISYWHGYLDGQNNQCEGWYEVGRCIASQDNGCARMLFEVNPKRSISECLHEYKRGYMEVREELWGYSQHEANCAVVNIISCRGETNCETTISYHDDIMGAALNKKLNDTGWLKRVCYWEGLE